MTNQISNAMWLLNIDSNLDLLWFDAKGNLVYKVKDAQICKNALDAVNCTYKNTIPAKYVICCHIRIYNKT